jgi:hypothetical protein
VALLGVCDVDGLVRRLGVIRNHRPPQNNGMA